MGEVDVVFRKYDGKLHRRAVELHLGEDEWGTWLGVPVGTAVHYVSAGFTRADEHRSVRLGCGDILGIKLTIDVNGDVDFLHDRIGALGEPAAPHLVAHDL